MPLWVLVTLLAALLQTLRTAQQRRLTDVLSVNGANFVRYLYGAPLSLALLVALVLGGAKLPTPDATFIVYVIVAAIGQIIATSLLILALTRRSFVVGTTLSKTEAVQAALFGAALLGEVPDLAGWLALGLSLVGIALFGAAAARRARIGWRAGLLDRGALAGLGAGALFGVTAVAIRGATLAFEGGPAAEAGGEFGRFVAAVAVLACVNAMQVQALGLYLWLREPLQLSLAVRNVRVAAPVGLLSIAGSLCWFYATALQSAALVRAVGQAELVFSWFAGRTMFREQPSLLEMAGIGLILAGVLVLVLLPLA